MNYTRILTAYSHNFESLMQVFACSFKFSSSRSQKLMYLGEKMIQEKMNKATETGGMSFQDFLVVFKATLSSLNTEQLQALNNEISREVGGRSKNTGFNRLKAWSKKNEAEMTFTSDLKDGIVTCTVSVTHSLFGIAYGTFQGLEKFGSSNVISNRDLKHVMEGASTDVIKVISLYCDI